MDPGIIRYIQPANLFSGMMEEDEFSLDIEVKGRPVTVEGRLRKSAYTYQFIFQVDVTELIVEKDDQGDLRAFAPGIRDGQPAPDQDTVKAILEEMKKLLG